MADELIRVDEDVEDIENGGFHDNGANKNPVFNGVNHLDEINNINKDYLCICLGREVINVPPNTVLVFFISIVILFACFAFIAQGIQVNVFIPIIFTILGYWIPSPLQAVSDRTRNVQQTKLLADLRQRDVTALQRPKRYPASI